MLAAAMAELAARPIERVLAHLDAPDSHAFAALYEKAGLPAAMQPVFVALLAAIARMPAGMRSDIRSGRKLDMRGVPERNLVRLALRASASMRDPSRLRLQAWLGRLEAESARAGLRRDIPAPV